MKLFNNKGFVRKILIVILTVTLISFIAPVQSQASIGGKLFEPITDLLLAIEDVAIGILNKTMVNTAYLYDSVTLSYEGDSLNTKGKGIWAFSLDENGEEIKPDDKKFQEKYDKWNKLSDEEKDVLWEKYIGAKVRLEYGNEMEGSSYYDSKKYQGKLNEGLIFDNDIEIPNILYCPEYIFSNKIAALDVNFINPGKYTDAQGNEETSTATTIAPLVANWYRALRNVAIVGLLSILVYVGIRILIGSTAQDKAKYKERLKDWFVGLCLLFAMHYIMAGMMMITEVITENISNNANTEIAIKLDGYDGEYWTDSNTGEKRGDNHNITFKTNYMGYIRIMAQSDGLGNRFAYMAMYLALIIFTYMFTITYLKRVLYMAFFTMIAPLVAMTYPLDKLADGNAQGFNMWFREYMLNAIIQPVHLILYTMIMGSVMELAIKNPIYGIVALGFLLPAEKFIKKMFRFDKGETTGALGAVAGGALAMRGLQSASRFSKGLTSGKGGKDDKIRTKDNAQIEDRRGKNDGISSPDDVLSLESGGIPLRGSSGGTGSGETGTGGSGSGSKGNSSEGERYTAEQRALDRQKEMAEQDGKLPYMYYNPKTGEYDENYNPEKDRYFNNPILKSDKRSALDRYNNYLANNNINKPRKAYNPHTKKYEERYDPTKDMKLLAGKTDESGKIFKDNDGAILPQRKRFKRVAGALGGQAWRGIKRMPGRALDGAKRTAIKGVKSLPRMAIRAGGIAAGVAATGALAAGAAITAGDAKTAASMMGTGALIGAGIGSGIGGRLADKVEQGNIGINETIRDSYYTKEERDAQKQAKRDKYDKEWKKREDNYKYLRDRAGMNNKQAKEFLEHSDTQAFLNAGITDINTIYNARKLKNDGKHNNIDIKGLVARAQLADKVSDGFKDNRAEQNSLAESMLKRNKNINTNRLIDDIIAIKKRPS